MNTYQDMLELKAKGLVTSKVDGHFETFKYARKVMYDYLWKTDPRLLEVRGHVFDTRNEKLVQFAPRKTFNYGEDGTWDDVSLNSYVRLYKKYNGFMACATMYENELLVSTTGTTTSDYAKLAKEEILKFSTKSDCLIHDISAGCTSVYEIIHDSDPHIVNEPVSGAIPLGWRYGNNYWQPYGDYKEMRLADALTFVQECKHEGYMMHLLNDSQNICKLKSPYYIGKKKLMRMNKNDVAFMYNYTDAAKQKLPAMWHQTVEYIVGAYNLSEWLLMPDQERRHVIEFWEGK